MTRVILSIAFARPLSRPFYGYSVFIMSMLRGFLKNIEYYLAFCVVPNHILTAACAIFIILNVEHVCMFKHLTLLAFCELFVYSG